MSCACPIIDLILDLLTAGGTVGAVIFALYTNYYNQNPKFRVVKEQTEIEDDKNLYYSIRIFNIGHVESIITRIGFSNKKLVKFQRFGNDLSAKSYKKNYKDDKLLDKISYFRFPVKIRCGEMINVVITKGEMLAMKENLKFNRISIRIILADETVKKVYLTKKEIDKYLEAANNYRG